MDLKFHAGQANRQATEALSLFLTIAFVSAISARPPLQFLHFCLIHCRRLASRLSVSPVCSVSFQSLWDFNKGKGFGTLQSLFDGLGDVTCSAVFDGRAFPFWVSAAVRTAEDGRRRRRGVAIGQSRLGWMPEHLIHHQQLLTILRSFHQPLIQLPALQVSHPLVA